MYVLDHTLKSAGDHYFHEGGMMAMEMQTWNKKWKYLLSISAKLKKKVSSSYF